MINIDQETFDKELKIYEITETNNNKLYVFFSYKQYPYTLTFLINENNIFKPIKLYHDFVIEGLEDESMIELKTCQICEEKFKSYGLCKGLHTNKHMHHGDFDYNFFEKIYIDAIIKKSKEYANKNI